MDSNLKIQISIYTKKNRFGNSKSQNAMFMSVFCPDKFDTLNMHIISRSSVFLGYGFVRGNAD